MAPNKPIKFDPQKHHRRSIRLSGYDYSQAGAYYVTIVTHQRDCLFGEVIDEEMTLSDLGKIADECWRDPRTFPIRGIGCVCGYAESRAWDNRNYEW